LVVSSVWRACALGKSCDCLSEPFLAHRRRVVFGTMPTVSIKLVSEKRLMVFVNSAERRLDHAVFTFPQQPDVILPPIHQPA
jgi:hypothetical protein